ncbi:alkaline phosphatase [Condylostylus longicornis]|uniref:alkaline phosphatase n=1 Tax=Condylostylus longicornis TaxID=2530218 RepID=UPI00244E12B4|nr:alkaline phosphatase [Condylostylus longicornis]
MMESRRRFDFDDAPIEQKNLPSNPSENVENILKCETQRERIRRLFKSNLFLGFATIILFCLFIIITTLCIALLVRYEIENESVKTVPLWRADLPDEQKFWFDKGIEELKTALNVKLNMKRAKNVIIFVGDGMGPNTVTASRIYGFKENGLLTWEKFPHMGMLKTYCADKQVPDSFSTATALFGGVKTNYETGGVDSTVKLSNCTASLDPNHHVDSIIKWAQEDGIKTGIVTTTRLTHATPASLYANVPDRRWECEATMPEHSKQDGCKDIARILIESEVAENINVLMGGGRQCLVSGTKGSKADPIDSWACQSKDGRDLIKEWKKKKEDAGHIFAVLSNNSDLNSFDTFNTDFVLGVFANGHLKYDHERDTGPAGMPSLANMTLKAIEVLKSKEKGFLLIVEGGMIDQAHHRGIARKALSETLALNDAVNASLNAMKDELDETLFIVTADHSHTLTINGYPKHGSNILGIGFKSKVDGIPYTTLTYGTSYSGYQVEIDNENGRPKRKDPSREDTTTFDYIQQSAILTDENTHGGSDVTIHALGPMAHLFHRIHENTYVAHVVSYALRIGRFRDSSIVESLANLF